MKRVLLSVLFFAFTIMFLSCKTYGQAITCYDENMYYEYYDEFYDINVVYISYVPYYRIWLDGRWNYRPVPRNRYGYIRHFDRPRIQPRYPRPNNHRCGDNNMTQNSYKRRAMRGVSVNNGGIRSSSRTGQNCRGVNIQRGNIFNNGMRDGTMLGGGAMIGAGRR